MVSLLGVCLLLFVAVGLSSNRAAIRLRTVLLAFGLQGGIGFVALWTDWGIAALAAASEYVAALLGYSRAGMEFMFGGLVGTSDSLGFIFAFNVLPRCHFLQFLDRCALPRARYAVDDQDIGWWFAQATGHQSH